MASLHGFSLPSTLVPPPISMRFENYPRPFWNGYVANSIDAAAELTGCSLPICRNVDDSHCLPEPRSINAPVLCQLSSGYASTTTSCVPTRSYPAQLSKLQLGSRRDSLETAPTSQRHEASPSVSFRSTNMSPVTTPFALVKMRPVGIKLFVQPENEIITGNESFSPCKEQVGRWTKQEHALFLEGLQRFGRSWKKIASLVHSRTLVQIRTHAQKYLLKQSRAGTKADTKALGAGASHLFQPRNRAVAEQQFIQTKRQWTSPQPRDRGYKVAPCFISQSQFYLTSTSRDQATTSARSTFQFKNTHQVDQPSQDINVTIPAFIDEYYTSPISIEDHLLRSLSTDKEWVPRTAQCSTFVNSYELCGPLESNYPVGSSISTSTAAITPTAMHPVVPNATSESLFGPTSPYAYC